MKNDANLPPRAYVEETHRYRARTDQSPLSDEQIIDAYRSWIGVSKGRPDAQRKEPVATWDLLSTLGFVTGEKCTSGDDWTRVFEFGNFELEAVESITWANYPVVCFGGVLSTSRTLALVEFDLPDQVESKEQLAAFIVYYLDKAGHKEVFVPARAVSWLELGRKNQHLLPWEQERLKREREQELYRARPHCLVARKWMRLALNTMAQHLDEMSGTDLVQIGFKEGLLTVRLGTTSIPLAATGDCWESDYSISVSDLQVLPKRLMNDPVPVGIWESSLEVDRYRYSGVKAA